MRKASKSEIGSILPMSAAHSQLIINHMSTQEITIRPAYADDQLALMRLADLDSAPTAPLEPLLLAEVDGQLRVALSLRDGTLVADPFFPTSGVVALLRHHARALEARRPRARRDPLSALWRGRQGLADARSA